MGEYHHGSLDWPNAPSHCLALSIIMTNRKKGKAETEIKHTLVNCNGPSTLLGYCVIDVGEVINGDGLLCKSPM